MYLTLHPDNMFQKMNSIRTVSKKTQGKKEKEKKEKREGEKDDSQVKECLLISNNFFRKNYRLVLYGYPHPLNTLLIH